MPLNRNLVLDVDSYKPSHPGSTSAEGQYPEKLTSMFDYVESRGGRYGTTLFFGLQAYIKEYLTTPITKADVDEAAKFLAAHGEPFPLAGWMRVVEQHNGYLPIRISAVAEGTPVPVGNILASIESTDPQIPWIVSWMETQILRAIWYPTTVATRSLYCKKVIWEALSKSSDDPRGELPFKLHDFGGRGVSSRESAGLGGMAHLVNFMGSDTIEGIRYANHYYNHDMAAFSIPAAEHSTMTIFGREGELNQMRRVIKQIKPGGLAACVSDSYDFYNAVENYWGDILHDEVKASSGTLVIRPDSGNPVEVNLNALRILERKIGTPKNLKGYKVLPKYYRLIQGDGNKNEDSIRDILDTLLSHGYSASNIGFGMGGGLLQADVDRDTQKFAMKLSHAVVDGRELDVSKDPITDHGKKSKRGRLDLVFRNGDYQTVQGAQRDSLLIPVFENGRLLKDWTLAEVRANAEKGLF
jgi:nicotinamide phosphoribosyltransferase